MERENRETITYHESVSVQDERCHHHDEREIVPRRPVTKIIDWLNECVPFCIRLNESVYVNTYMSRRSKLVLTPGQNTRWVGGEYVHV